MSLRIYDSARHAVVDFVPVEPGKVGIYLCGATVQGAPHIGHVRSAVAFDVLIRWLKRSGYEVTYVRNVTDIDDKILNKSAEAGKPWWAWAMRFEREFAAAYRALGLIEPTYEPRATGHITDQIALIKRLEERGHAYADGTGNVYFDVRSLADYGSLTRQNLDDLRTTEDDSQIDSNIEAGKRDPRDFALWKAAKDSEPDTAKWDSPWGVGRPGWHLECSAMSQRYLGDEFDIHGGGIDLRFPHHENEQAQSHGAGWGFAKYWMHNAWVTIKGEKMSKSLGNSLVVSEILKTTSAPVLRLALGVTHYRSTIEYSEESLEIAANTWNKFSSILERASKLVPAILQFRQEELAVVALPESFSRAMDDDLNIAGAMAAVHEEIKLLNRLCSEPEAKSLSAWEKPAEMEGFEPPALVAAAIRLRAMLDVIGLDPLAENWASGATVEDGDNQLEKALDTLINAQLEARAAARAEKDWARADAIRDSLTEAGIIIEDSPTGATWRF